MKSPRFTHKGISYPLFTYTSAMDCWSWSLPAGKDFSCPMEQRCEGSICNSCYAQQNRYLFGNVLRPQIARFERLKEDPITTLNLVSECLSLMAPDYFRVHDSGDFHSVEIIDLWRKVCEENPLTRFWFPTRAWVFPAWMPALTRLASLPNTSVRPSAIRFGDEPPAPAGLDAGTVSMNQHMPGIHDCPKTIHGGSCMSNNCRTCWGKENYVNYRPHGHVITPRERQVRLTIGATT